MSRWLAPQQHDIGNKLMQASNGAMVCRHLVMQTALWQLWAAEASKNGPPIHAAAPPKCFRPALRQTAVDTLSPQICGCR